MSSLIQRDDEEALLLFILLQGGPPTTTTAPPIVQNYILGKQDQISIVGYLEDYQILGKRDLIQISGASFMAGQGATPIERPAGSGLPIQWSYVNSLDGVTPVSLANVSNITLTVRAGKSPSSTLLFSKSLLNGDISILDSAGGVALINIDFDDTESIAPGRYYYDIKVDFSSGPTPDYPTCGPFILTEHVNR